MNNAEKEQILHLSNALMSLTVLLSAIVEILLQKGVLNAIEVAEAEAALKQNEDIVRFMAAIELQQAEIGRNKEGLCNE